MGKSIRIQGLSITQPVFNIVTLNNRYLSISELKVTVCVAMAIIYLVGLYFYTCCIQTVILFCKFENKTDFTESRFGFFNKSNSYIFWQN